ncbi:UPF0496 protein At4g34320-like [Macadamia integrifolia]|uniref:UPF0496 protein At4g34320-like n=1 Tax=Macadamia integrifolia TaxID=60698 RepID=UPI001C4E8110|nr:UPF0496 protein At4g34320-like [Macadamia integrifolia]
MGQASTCKVREGVAMQGSEWIAPRRRRRRRRFSKRTGEEVPPVLQLDTNLQYTAELSSNEAAFTLDPNLQSFDCNPQLGPNRVIDTIASGVELRDLCFESLKEVSGSLDEVNHEIIQAILDCKKGKWKNQQLLELVNDYFHNSPQTLGFCTAFEKCLSKARENQSLILHVALPQFEKEVKNFKAAGNPLTEDFFQEFGTIHKHQVLMFQKLQLRKNTLDKKLEFVKPWRKISNIIFAVTSAAAFTCSVVAASMSASHIVAAVAATTSIPVGSIGKWFNSLLTGYENELQGQMELISSMQVKDLDSIWVPVNCLAIEIQTLTQNANSAHREGEALKILVEDIKKNIEDLIEQADRCSQDIRRARTVVLQRASKHPNSYSNKLVCTDES